MGLQNWSTTPANNANAAPNINMATGSAPSTVHPSVRQMMADVASWYADPEWVLQADTPTYTSATTFTVPTNRTATYSVGRRIQMAGPGIGAPYTINGTITASAFGTVTTVTVQWDAGALDNTVSSVAVGILQNQLSTLLSDLANTTDPTKGAAMVGTIATGVGAIPQTLAQKLLTTPVSDDAYENVNALFNIAGERLSRRILQFGATLDPIASTLTIENANTYSSVGLIVRGAGFNLGTPQDSSGLDGTGLNAALINFDRTTATNNDAQTVLEDFALIGGAAPAISAGTQDGIAGSSTDLITNRLLIQYMNRHGINLDTSFSTKINSGLIFGNFGNGINYTNAANRVAVRDVRAFNNGRSFTTQDQANIFMLCNGNTGYGPIIENCDVSYSGFTQWSYALGNLVSVVVSGGVCTVTTSVAHGLATGNFIGIKLSGNAALDSILARNITVTSPTTFTFVTPAPNGSYTAPGLVIGPHSNGLEMLGVDGLRINGLYCETPMGLAAYFGNCKSGTLDGGFVLNGTVYIDSSCENFDIGGIKFNGTGGLYTVEANQRATLNVKSSNTFEDGAVWTRTSFYMYNGVRYGSSIPTTGTWTIGEYLLNSGGAGAGDPIGWICTASGTPGTFKTLGIVGHTFMPAQPNSVAATVPEIVTDFNTLLANLRAANLMST